MNAELVTYIPPTAAEWQQTNELVKAVAATEFVPVAMRGKPAAVLACVLTGRELGIGPMQSLKHVAIIEGKPGLSAELMAGLVRSRGHKLRIITRAQDEAEVEGVRADDPQHPLRVCWTLKDAERAGLCKIQQDGRPTARDRNNKPMPWEKYPDALLLARAISALCRALFADVLAGFSYTAEEIQSGNGQTDAVWGEVEVDTSTGEVLEGSPGAGAGAVTTTPAPAPAASRFVPKLPDIELVRSVRDAKQLIQSSTPAFQALVPHAISALYHTDPHLWWDQTSKVDAWKQVLEYTVELHEQQHHEKTSAAGTASPPRAPAADPQSDPEAASPAAGSDPSSNPGRADRRTREGSTESAMTPGLDDPVGGDDDAAS